MYTATVAGQKFTYTPARQRLASQRGGVSFLMAGLFVGSMDAKCEWIHNPGSTVRRGRFMQTPISSDAEGQPPEPTVASLSAVIAHLQASVERERVRLTRSLHDDLGGLLVSAVMDLGWLEQHQAAAPALGEAPRSSSRAALAAAIDLKRNLIEELRPSLLDNFGLFDGPIAGMSSTAANVPGVTCIERYPQDELNLQPEALAGLFRTMQETLAVIFAEPAIERISVSVEVVNQALVLRTEHTHLGPETTDVFDRLPAQMGAITRRVDALGGRFSSSRHATGTLFVARFPMDRVVAAA